MELRRHEVKFGFLQGLFFAKTASLCEQGLIIDGKLFTYPSIEQTVEVRAGWFTQTLVWGNNKFIFFRFSQSKPLFKLARYNRLVFCRPALLQTYDDLLVDIASFDKEFGLHQRYLRHSDRARLHQGYSGTLAAFKQTVYFNRLGFDVTKLNCRLAKFIKQPEQFTQKYNQWWQDKQLEAYQTLFDSLEAHPLTDLQRQACVIDENNTLVIAGAGTGKTSTMAAKAAYLVKQGLAKPDEILMLAYGKDAMVELKQRVYTIPGLNSVKVSTFHGLGKEIIQSYLDESTQVSVLASDTKKFTQFVDQQLDAIVADSKMADPVADYFGRYLYPQVNELDFQTQGQYRSYLKNNEIRALSGDLVKSFQELTICNYLFTHGIQFEYEAKYAPKEGVLVSEPGKSVYQPDFYIPALDAYLEHFGIDKQGPAPKGSRPDIDKTAYNLSREWKIDTHKRHNTCLLQTFSWQADLGELEKNLEALLCERCEQLGLAQNQVFKPISPEAVFAQVKALGVYRNVSRLMSSFLSLFKASTFSLADLEQIKLTPASTNNAKSDKKSTIYNQVRWKAFLHLFRWVITQYEAHLRSLKTLDFSDMISQGIEMTQKSDFHQRTQGRFRYKYIMVDEFQDISAERAKLVTQLRDSSPGCALFCVGDDWQAIYRFTGSDLKLTTEFDRVFGASRIVTLDKTFRFNDRIEKVASSFIQANPAQLKKTLTTHTLSDNPEVCLLINSKETGLAQAFNSIVEAIASNLAASSDSAASCTDSGSGSEKGTGKGTEKDTSSTSVMVISRFKSSLKDLSVWQKRYSQLQISGFSAHGSKGKQADFVIVLDVNDDKYGFPSKIASDPILEALLPKLDKYAYTEERRLFYVALSRAKQTVFVQAELGKESVFVKELRTFNNDVHCYLSDLAPLYIESLSCPECNAGKLIPTQGRYGLFYACSLGKHYCDTKLDACTSCKSAPMLRNETHHICASAECDHQLQICPECVSGKLIKRTNSKSGKAFLACSLHKMKDENSCQYTSSLAG
ncbi:UvrD-helicase domain-containing protein [Shewanella violacea]|uniref:DNA 3'-5' helicase n=1 Tax=Shewanella violacea (strain JCM 10179 / CIP 106290 / LMG 19151 / DSS12) TaxID=637905 RepID=D4ZK91_SHEVD|nr:UvrD-helicase domain-containing protein [Shewanella violacea]BAJ02090.1 UvrD/REP helicase family protein [Shewanella violacea DSS12]